MYLDFIIDFANVGDSITIECGDKTFSGSIVKITPDLIAIKTGKAIIIKKDSEITNSPVLGAMDDEIDDLTGKVESKNKADEPKQECTAEQKTQAQDTPKTPNAYKPGDVIPLEVLHKIDPITAKPKIQKKEKLSQTFNDLSALAILVEEEHAIQNEKYVPAMGEIKWASFDERNFGWIIDGKTGNQLYFSFNQIIDKSIDKSSRALLHMPVVYSIQGNEHGEMAITIHRPNKVKDLMLLAQNLLKINDFKHASRVLDHILNEYPDNFAASELKNKIEKQHPKSQAKNYPIKAKTYSDLYNQAKKCHLAREYAKAIEYYVKAIDAGEKLEASIKDLGMLYAQLYKQGGNNASMYKENVTILLAEHKKDLPNNISTLYYLENLYYAIQDYDHYLEVAKELSEEREIRQDNNKRIQLLRKIAAVYVQLEDIEKARIIIEQALQLDPDNIWALQLKTAIESENKADIQEVISATQFESLTSGLSSFIQQTLDEYNDYAAVPAKIKESGAFDETTLKGVRSIIEKFRGRSKERATYLLTEAKLMQNIEPENTTRLRSVLARYCIDMATTHIADNSSLDVIRFYYNEAFSLEENYDNNAQNVAIYVLTQIFDYGQLLQATTQHVPVNTALKQVINSSVDIKWWINILYMFIYNRAISANLTSLFYSNTDYQVKAISALKKIGITFNNARLTKEEFTEAWNSAREKLLLYNYRIIATIRNITNTSNLEDFYQQLSALDAISKDWMCALDIIRLNNITSNIAPAISAYLKSSGYRNKKQNRDNAYGLINQLIEEIESAPTKLSYEELLPLLKTMEILLSKSFNEVIRMSEPKISIRLLSEQTVVNNNGIVNIQVEVENHKDSSPIKEVSLFIDKREDMKLINAGDVLYNAIEGGESHIFKLQLEVGDDIIRQKATAMTIYCNYQNGNEIKQASNQIPLKLYSQEEFTPIENPYAPIADGGPVPLDSKMFYGRETEIENIVDAIIKSPSKQIIIYGQKRSGKSSVMLHLKQSLLHTGKTFCVFFSLGEIINNLNEASFYYKIVSSIKQELEFLESDGVEDLPPFEIPSPKVFKEEDEENPLNTFTKYMIKFKLSCKQTKGWENKNLVVMIDEFTYLYTEIKKGNISPSIMKQWKAITQNERAQFSVVLVGQDVVPSFKKEDYARNAFGVIQDMRLTYLKDQPARALIETPILDEDGKSRYIGDAVSRIIEYTSRNPYYIQIFCSRLVDYMNDNKSISVTEADVNEVARSFIEGSDALEEDKFDNLIRAGESEDLQAFPESDILSILRQIAQNSKNIGYCNRRDIDVFEDKNREEAILKDLYDREVLEMKGEDNYKIQVKLFQEWLLNH